MIIAAMLMLASQDATVARPAVEPDGGQRWSILADPCGNTPIASDDILVCAEKAANPRLPLPAERGPPDHAIPSNPDISGAGALAVARGAPCNARVGGCQVGIDILGGATFLVRATGKLADPDSCCEAPGEATNPVMLISDAASVVGKVFKKKPDKSNRVPIPLDDLPPASGAAPAGPINP